MDQGRRSYLIISGLLLLSSVLVYLNPRSLPAFLLLLSVPLLLYFLHTTGRFKALIAILLLLGIMPVVGIRNIFYLEVAFQIAVFSALALGLNIVVGFAGLLDLGYIAFYAVGAYVWAIFGSKQLLILNAVPGTAPASNQFPLDPNLFWLFLFLAVGLTALTGVLLGTPVLRLRGDYLAIVTLGFGEVIRVLANNLDKPINLTNGPQGITPIQRPPLPPDFITEPLRSLLQALVGHNVSDAQLYNLFFYLMALAVVGVAVTLATRLDNSRLGRAWVAIREDETAAIAMGIPLVRTKLMAFAIGASFSGAMGVLFAANRTFVSPESFSLLASINILVMIILGGIGSIPGVILGAALVTILNIQVLQELSLFFSQLRQQGGIWSQVLSTQLDPAKYQRLIFGVILVVMMIKRPGGILPARRRQLELAESQEETQATD
ncbi:MAG: branched-chain amino acid ABC transporter permease [Ardenticatenales bacterium]|nr:branched-chain amino acid ABC transporter permease [Ardenticatenales bacterium]